MHPLRKEHITGLLCAVGLTCSALSASADDVKTLPRFYPHLTTTARTVGAGHLSYEPFPGSNGLESLFFNSLNIGIGQRFQIGTIPVFYAIDDHIFNIAFKWNAWNTRLFQLSAGMSGLVFHNAGVPQVAEADGTITRNPTINVTYGVLILNLFPFGDRLSFGGNINFVGLDSTSKALTAQLKARKLQNEWFVDVAWKLSDYFVLTSGAGRRRLDTLDPLNSPIPPGYGLSISWTRRSAKWFPRLTLGGNYCPPVARQTLLFSFEI